MSTENYWTIEELEESARRAESLGLVALTRRVICPVCGRGLAIPATIGRCGEYYHMSCLYKLMKK